MAYIGKSPTGTGVRSRYYFTATAGATSLSGADDNSNTLVFSDGNYVDVSLNGIALVAGTDYNTSTANTISGLSALSSGDIVEVVVYDIFTVADTVSAKDGGTFSGAITANSGLSVGTIKEATGTTTAMTIDSTGRVFKPSIPFFVLLGGNEGDKTVGNNETLGATNDGQSAFLSSGTIAGIRGFTYTSTTGVITVPVDGLYHIGANIFSNANETTLIALYQNSSIIQYVNVDLIGNATMDIVANLSSGDELTFRNVRGADSVIYEGKAHTQVYGYLIG